MYAMLLNEAFKTHHRAAAWPALERHLAQRWLSLVRAWSSSARNLPKSAQRQSIRTKLGRNWSGPESVDSRTVGKSWLFPGRIWRVLVELRPQSVGFGPNLVDAGPSLPSVGRCGPNIGRQVAQRWSIPGEVGSHSVGDGPNSAEFGRLLAKCGRCQSKMPTTSM